MAILNPSDLTFNGEEIRSIREAILEQVFAKPAVTDFHTVYEDIVTKKQIAFLGRLGKITRVNAGCSSSPLSAGITNSEKFWEPVRFEIWLSECYTNLEDTFFVWAKQRGLAEPDLTGTDFAAFLVERMTDAILGGRRRHFNGDRYIEGAIGWQMKSRSLMTKQIYAVLPGLSKVCQMKPLKLLFWLSPLKSSSPEPPLVDGEPDLTLAVFQQSLNSSHAITDGRICTWRLV